MCHNLSDFFSESIDIMTLVNIPLWIYFSSYLCNSTFDFFLLEFLADDTISIS